MKISTLDLINLISSLASLILSIIAIWLSLYFYKESKNNEEKVNMALSEIKTHTGVLEKLTGKWIDRLTRFVTSPQPMDSAAEKLLASMEKMYLQGSKETGTLEAQKEQPLMYKEEEAAQFVKANIPISQKRKVQDK